MGREGRQTTLYIPEDLLLKLKEKASMTHRTVSNLIIYILKREFGYFEEKIQDKSEVIENGLQR